MSKSKLGLVVGVVALAVPLFGATSAQAQEITAACVFSGATGNINAGELPAGTAPTGDIDPGHPLGAPFDSGVQSVVQDNRLGPIRGDFDGGGYTFSTVPPPATGSTTCAVDSDHPGQDGMFDGDITSKGHYNNEICGTGTAIDDDVQVDPNAPPEITTVDLNPPGASENDIVDADYNLNFRGGEGDLDITRIDDSIHVDTAEVDSTPGAGDVDGFVNIVPDETTPGSGNCGNLDVSRFLAEGAFTATWSSAVHG